MTEHHLTIKKTARYYTLGTLNEHTRQVWIVLHGFAQKAQPFLSNFEPLLNPHTFFIAPEALNYFYLKGPAGDVGTTWMTKEDRLNQINDYINYLDDVYTAHGLGSLPNIKITALGFSQGASTVTRWVNATRHRIDTLLVYAGEVGAEVFPIKAESGLRKSRNYFICGTGDEIFTPEVVAQMKKQYAEMNFEQYIDFNGGHVIDTNTLQPFLQ